MGVYSVAMKIHSRENVTDSCGHLNTCIKHGEKPKVFKLVVGHRKEIMYTVLCPGDKECNRISSEKNNAVDIWNKWNDESLIRDIVTYDQSRRLHVFYKNAKEQPVVPFRSHRSIKEGMEYLKSKNVWTVEFVIEGKP